MNVEVKKTMSIDDVDFSFENTPTKLVISRNFQELIVDGVNIGPIEEGKELETKYWIGYQLVASGLASFHGNRLMTYNALYKIHWKETKIQTGRRVSSLPEYFYPKLRRYLKQLKAKAVTDTTRAIEYNNALRLTNDVVNCRLKKIVGLSSSGSQTEDVLQKLTKEERILYESLQSIVSDWRSKILKVDKSE